MASRFNIEPLCLLKGRLHVAPPPPARSRSQQLTAGGGSGVRLIVLKDNFERYRRDCSEQKYHYDRLLRKIELPRQVG